MTLNIFRSQHYTSIEFICWRYQRGDSSSFFSANFSLFYLNGNRRLHRFIGDIICFTICQVKKLLIIIQNTKALLKVCNFSQTGILYTVTFREVHLIGCLLSFHVKIRPIQYVFIEWAWHRFNRLKSHGFLIMKKKAHLFWYQIVNILKCSQKFG